MSLPIITADERLAEVRGVKAAIFGPPGIGKTRRVIATLKRHTDQRQDGDGQHGHLPSKDRQEHVDQDDDPQDRCRKKVPRLRRSSCARHDMTTLHRSLHPR